MWFFTVTKNLINVLYSHYLSHPYLMPSNNTLRECFPTFQGIFLCDAWICQCQWKLQCIELLLHTQMWNCWGLFWFWKLQVSFLDVCVDMDCANNCDYTINNDNQCERKRAVQNIFTSQIPCHFFFPTSVCSSKKK